MNTRHAKQCARLGSAATALAIALLANAGSPFAQALSGDGSQAPQRITIPYLANATRPRDLDFAAAECELAAGGARMTCRVRQLFVTVASFDATACVVTTNGYERTFERQTPTRWTSADPPAGACGIVETTTLEDGGGTRWTMTIAKSATRGADRAECRAEAGQPEIYSWQGMKRALPCTTIQPGAIER